MKLLILILTLLFACASFAGDRNTAYEAVCKNMPFSPDRAQCVQTIKPFNYFDNSALSICQRLPFASTQMECLGIIGDKRYEAYEINACIETVFESERLKCLRDNGQNNGGQNCLPNRDVFNQLRAAQNELRQGQYGTVDKRLTYLMGQFSGNCQ